MFRAHFLYFWLICNALFGGFSVFLTSGGGDVKRVNDGSFGFVDGFAMFVAFLVIFRFVCALIYTLKWNFRTWTNPYYRKSNTDVAEEFKRLRKNRNGALSSDEDEDDEDYTAAKLP